MGDFLFPFFAFTAMHSPATFDACIYGLCHTVSVMNEYLTASSDFSSIILILNVA